MENVVCGHLENLGYEIKSKAIKPEDLFLADQVIVTNSLMGAVPVISFDGKKIAEPTDLCQKINDLVL
jgi:para-aminobenzoate synthetase component 1